jgi:phosphoglycerol transferase MdoB-like AlkP superfamily enzyme
MSVRLPAAALRPLVPPLRAILLLLVVFAGGRAGFLLLHGGAFSQVTAAERVRAFAEGIRFDGCTILRYVGVPLVLLVVPVPARIEGPWRRVWGWTAYVVAALLALLLAIDLGYFPYLHRHVASEILLVREEAGNISSLLATEYRWGVVGMLLLWTALWFAWRRWVVAAPPPAAEPVARRTSWIVAVAASVLALVGARGVLAGKHLRLTQAYEGRSAEEAHLVLNAPFVIWSLAEWSGTSTPEYMPWAEAVADARAVAFRASESPAGERFPLARSAGPRAPIEAAAGPPPHVLLLVLEGWSADALDVLRRSRGLEPLGASSGFDRLAERGRLFTRCYAAGQRTNNGYSALLTGLAQTPDTPILTDGLEQLHIPTLPKIAAAHGYDRVLLHGAARGTQTIEWVGDRIGFGRVVAAEDFGASGERRSDEPPPELLDGPLLGAVEKVLEKAERPTLVVAKTQDTHARYPVAPPAPLLTEEAGQRREFLDVLHASDASLGAFFDRFLATEAGRRTVVVVVSDHIQRNDAPGRVRTPDLFWIPMLVLAPGVAPGRDDRVVSQTDVLPTLLDLLGWGDAHASTGSSVLAPDRPAHAGAMCSHGGTVLRVEAEGWVVHDLGTRVDAEATTPGADLTAIQHRLLATAQVLRTICREDRIVPP